MRIKVSSGEGCAVLSTLVLKTLNPSRTTDQAHMKLARMDICQDVHSGRTSVRPE